MQTAWYHPAARLRVGYLSNTRLRLRFSSVTTTSLCAAIWLTLMPTSQVLAQQQRPTEYQVKAAYLFNFGKFVEWPDKPEPPKGEPFEICVLGDDPFGAALDATVTGATIHGKDVAAKRIAKPEQGGDCKVLFISVSEGGHLPEVLSALGKMNVLTVSDISQFSQRGGMIQFVRDGDRVRFEVNLANVEGAGLNLSSELLKVAVRVTRTPYPGM